ncbi:MAG TPA: DUF4921 family protein [Candidatus Kapabacteria bacterium]|nr:DUF4921 family protein [Candidatus Kapabacteria bacterium]
MPDGTVKQINPFTGNEVWAVPGRASKPSQFGRGNGAPEPEPIGDIDRLAVCSFCEKRYFETSPEKSRWVVRENRWSELVELPAAEYFDSVAEFRRVANLFEIVTLDYWKKNYGYVLPKHEQERMREYLASPIGHKHLEDVVAYKRSYSKDAQGSVLSNEEELIRYSEPFFGGCHELITARRHYRADGSTERDLVSSGVLSGEEHYYYFRITVDAIRAIIERNRYVRYVSVFQNWLREAGASFDHLHKQLVGIDEWGASISRQVKMLKEDPNVFNEYGANFAAMYNLVFAENEYAMALVGIGHRFPTIEIFSKSVHDRPYEHSLEELRGVSDLVHACHAATGAEISCNEEWYYSPVDAMVKMPWHVLIKWRINVTAGFEGGTSIYINPMTPHEMRDRIVPRLYALRDAGIIAPIRIAEECRIEPNPLKYVTSS